MTRSLEEATLDRGSYLFKIDSITNLQRDLVRCGFLGVPLGK